MYHQILDGRPDNSILFGHPQPVRSDEWLVVTPFTVSQYNEHLPLINSTIGSGFDASVIVDVPYRDWSQFFKPHNWSFFILPLENAYAFKWWIMGYFLIISTYFLTLIFLPKQKLLAIFLSIGLFATPFIQWWYLYGTLGSIYYCNLAVIVFYYLMRPNSLQQKIVLSLALAYVLSCFALILYPPFQIPCALAAAALCMGYFFYTTRPLTWHSFCSKLGPVAASLAIAGIIVGAFFLTRTHTIEAITGTVYPGHRVDKSGGFKPTLFLDGVFNAKLQRPTGTNYASNQSESSNFIYLWPYLFIPSVYLIAKEWRTRRKINYPLLLVNAVLLLFASRMLLPMPAIFARLLLLDIIPHNRLKIGLGLLEIIQIILIVKALKAIKLHVSWAILAGIVAMTTQILAGFWLKTEYPLFGLRTRFIIIMAACVGAMVFFILQRRAVIAAALLMVIGVYSTININPLYVGLGELTHSRLGEAAKSEPGAETNGWVYLGSASIINLLQSQGLKSYSGTYPYPQLDYFTSLDPEKKYTAVYNRYGHAAFTPNGTESEEFKLNGADSFSVYYDPCSPRFQRYIKRVVSQVLLDSKRCLVLDKTIQYNQATFYIYSVL